MSTTPTFQVSNSPNNSGSVIQRKPLDVVQVEVQPIFLAPPFPNILAQKECLFITGIVIQNKK